MSIDEVYEEGEREEFPPDEFEAEEERPAPVNSSDEEGEPDAKKVKTKSAAKKVVKNPQAKLDDMRLCGQRGIPLLPKTFRDVKFKGKGHEAHDLDLYLSKMEHWAHRMFPKMVFDEVIERCDRLYKTKKLVKTTLIRMRNGDNLLDDDDVAREGDDVGFNDDDDDIDDVIARDASILSTTRPLRDEEDEESQASQEPSQPRTLPSAPAPPVQISDEIRERIERNKRIAMEKRLARMQAMQNSQTESSVAASTGGEAPLGSGHSMPTVVSKPTQPLTAVSRQEDVSDKQIERDADVGSVDSVVHENANVGSIDSVVHENAEANLNAEIVPEPETRPLGNESNCVDDETPSASLDENSESCPRPVSEVTPVTDPVAEADLDEDELLKLINE